MWIYSRTFALFSVTLCVLAIAHSVATVFFLYWVLPWFDIPMHTLGGAVVALGFLLVCQKYVHGPFGQGLAVVLCAVFLVGIWWEIFELMNDITTFSDSGYAWDTTQDLVMDVIGGFLGYVSARTGGAGEEPHSAVSSL